VTNIITIVFKKLFRYLREVPEKNYEN